MKRKFTYLLYACFLALSIMACGNTGSPGGDAQAVDPSDDSYFVFDSDNELVSLTDKGKEQEYLVVPDKCTGVNSGVFTGSAVKTVAFEGDDDIGDMQEAFLKAEDLEEVVLPGGMKAVGFMAFADCPALKSITLPEGIESVGDYAFSGCSSLNEIVFTGTSLREIGENAFEYCALGSVTMPEGVETIGMYGFYGNDGLTSVWLPSTLKVLAAQSFDGCPVEEVHMQGDMHPEEISPMAFGAANPMFYITKGSWLAMNTGVWADGFSYNFE